MLLVFVANEPTECTTGIIVTSTNDSHMIKNDNMIVNTLGVIFNRFRNVFLLDKVLQLEYRYLLPCKMEIKL